MAHPLIASQSAATIERRFIPVVLSSARCNATATTSVVDSATGHARTGSDLGTAFATLDGMAPIPPLLAATLVLSTIPALAVAQRAEAQEDRSWKPAHIALAAGFVTTLWIDAAQTREAMALGYREMNPILGPHPSEGQINTYTVLAGLTVMGVAAAVSPRWRPWVLGAALAVQVVTIAATVRQRITIPF